MMCGCPFIKNDENKNCEICKLTGKPTGVSLTCDFDYDTDCSIYKRQTKKQKSKVKK